VVAIGAESVLARNLPSIALRGLETLATRVAVPVILFDAIFIPSDNPLVDEGPVPDRPNMTYRWAHDENQVTFRALVDGQWRTLTDGRGGPNAAYYSPDGEIVARMVLAPGRPPTLVTSVDVLDHALADLNRANSEPANDPAAGDHQPKLCPAPTPEAKTTNSRNSIAYQEYVSGLPYGWAIRVGDVDFDGCELSTGHLLEAKANIDHLFDENDEVFSWVDWDKNPKYQMERQVKAARAAGRLVIWHAQTEKGYRGLSKIAAELGATNLFVVYDPN
jgi:hypothetical protein